MKTFCSTDQKKRKSYFTVKLTLVETLGKDPVSNNSLKKKCKTERKLIKSVLKCLKHSLSYQFFKAYHLRYILI